MLRVGNPSGVGTSRCRPSDGQSSDSKVAQQILARLGYTDRPPLARRKPAGLFL